VKENRRESVIFFYLKGEIKVEKKWGQGSLSLQAYKSFLSQLGKKIM